MNTIMKTIIYHPFNSFCLEIPSRFVVDSLIFLIIFFMNQHPPPIPSSNQLNLNATYCLPEFYLLTETKTTKKTSMLPTLNQTWQSYSPSFVYFGFSCFCFFLVPPGIIRFFSWMCCFSFLPLSLSSMPRRVWNNTMMMVSFCLKKNLFCSLGNQVPRVNGNV